MSSRTQSFNSGQEPSISSKHPHSWTPSWHTCSIYQHENFILSSLGSTMYYKIIELKGQVKRLYPRNSSLQNLQWKTCSSLIFLLFFKSQKCLWALIFWCNIEILRVKLYGTMLWEIKFNALNIVVCLEAGKIGSNWTISWWYSNGQI